MESKTGSSLAFISAILNFIGAGFVFLIAIIMSIIILSGAGETSGEMSRELAAVFLFVILSAVAIGLLIIGLLFRMASKRMKNPATVKNGAIWSLILGILTFGNLAGILGIVGGAIGLSDANK